MFSDLLEALTELPDQALDDRIREIALQRRRLDAEFAATIKVAENRQLGAVDGHRTINSYLRATLNCSSTEASRLRSLARAVDEIDGLGHAWLTGRIGESQVTRFAVLNGNRRVRDRLPEFAPILIDDAEQLSYSEFSHCVDRFVSQLTKTAPTTHATTPSNTATPSSPMSAGWSTSRLTVATH